METNNFVECWHNQLKSTYLGRKRNRRADRLVYILVNDLEPDFIANTNHIQLNVGRMGPEERRRRRRELDAEAINEEVIKLLIQKVEATDVYRVKSFTTEGFSWNHIACKHMYLLKRFDRNIILFVVSTDLSAPRLEQAIPSQNEQDSSNNTAINTNGADILRNISNTITAYLHNPRPFTSSEIQSLENIQNAFNNI